MAIRSHENLVGARAFLIGVVIAIAGGIILSFGYSINPLILSILVILGLLIGFFINVSGNAGTTFLLATVSLVIVSFAGIQSATSLAGVKFAEAEIIGIQVGRIISSILSALLILLIPSTIVVAIKSLFSIAQQ